MTTCMHDLPTISTMSNNKPTYESLLKRITDLEKDNYELKKNEEKYRLAVEATSDGIWEWNLHTNHIFYSPAYYEMIGYQKDEFKITLNSWKKIIHPDDYEKVIEANQNIKNGKTNSFSIEYRLKAKNGDYIWVLGRGKILERDINRKAIRIIGTHTNITQQKKIEFALKQSEENYNITIEHSPDAIILFRYNKVISISPLFFNRLGYQKESFKDISKDVFFELIHPDDRENAKQLFYEGIIKKKTFDNFTYRMLCKNGDIVWIDHYLTRCYDKNGEPEISVIIARDITDRIKTEQALKNALKDIEIITENIPNVIWKAEIDPDGSYRNTYISEIVNELLALPKGTLKNDFDKYFSFVKPQYMEGIKQAFSEGIANPGKTYSFIYEVIKANSETAWIQTTGRAYFVDNLCLVYGYSVDISSKIIAEQALKESEKKLRESNTAKDKLFSIIAHDLKNPLGNVVGFSELLYARFESFTPDKVKAFTSYIYQSAISLTDLLENLLKWSLSQRNKITVDPQNIDLYSIVKECIEILNPSVIRKEISLINRLKTSTIVFADINMITTVIRNLTSNAIKFTNRGGKITLNAFISENNNSVVISISDTGVGMSQEIIDKLFEVDGTKTTNGTDGEKGTGLGLIICKEFIEKNNGLIWVESELNKGTNVYFSLPGKSSEYKKKNIKYL